MVLFHIPALIHMLQQHADHFPAPTPAGGGATMLEVLYPFHITVSTHILQQDASHFPNPTPTQYCTVVTTNIVPV